MSVTAWGKDVKGLYVPQSFCIKNPQYQYDKQYMEAKLVAEEEAVLKLGKTEGTATDAWKPYLKSPPQALCDLPVPDSEYYFVKAPKQDIENVAGIGKSMADAFEVNLPDTWKEIVGTKATDSQVKQMTNTPNTTSAIYLPNSSKFYVPNQGWFVTIPDSKNPSDPVGTPDPTAAKTIAWKLVKGTKAPNTIPKGWCAPIDPCPKGVLCCTDSDGKLSPAEYNGPDASVFQSATSFYIWSTVGGILGLCILVCIVYWFIKRKRRRL